MPSIVSGGGLRSYLLISIGAGAPYTSHDSTDAATLNLLSSTWCSSMPSATGPGPLPTALPPATGLCAAVCSAGLWGSVPVKAPGLLGDALAQGCALQPCQGSVPWGFVYAPVCQPLPVQLERTLCDPYQAGRAASLPCLSALPCRFTHLVHCLMLEALLMSKAAAMSFFGSTDSISVRM